ncbi:hypothetical protein D9M70_586180 [compost metagenome]
MRAKPVLLLQGPHSGELHVSLNRPRFKDKDMQQIKVLQRRASDKTRGAVGDFLLLAQWVARQFASGDGSASFDFSHSST